MCTGFDPVKCTGAARSYLHGTLIHGLRFAMRYLPHSSVDRGKLNRVTSAMHFPNRAYLASLLDGRSTALEEVRCMTCEIHEHRRIHLSVTNYRKSEGSHTQQSVKQFPLTSVKSGILIFNDRYGRSPPDSLGRGSDYFYCDIYQLFYRSINLKNRGAYGQYARHVGCRPP